MKKTNLNTIVSIAEILSSLAVVLSLFYALYEYKRSNTLTNRDVENIIYNRMMEMDRLIIENNDLSKIILMASSSPEELTPDEQLRYVSFEHIFYDGWETAWYYYHDGILENTNLEQLEFMVYLDSQK